VIRLPRLVLAAVSVALLPACLRLDTFVFRELAAPDDTADLLAASVVPAALREEVKTAIVSADGTIVNAYLLEHALTDGTPVARHGVGILYVHGNNTYIGSTVPRLDALWKLGYTVLAVDTRGYGKTKGAPTEEGVYADARAARTYFEGRTDLGMSKDTVGIYGRSLGTLVATKIASETPPKALILESPVLSIQTIIDDSLTIGTPEDWYVDTFFDNEKALPGFTGALLIMHGDADDYVQPKYGERLHVVAEGHAHPNDFWLVPGANHGTVPCVSPVEAPVDDDCTGGISPTYQQKVTAHYDTAFGIAD
jgi:pimeloyl-ACP methyl ester carboxylesterase